MNTQELTDLEDAILKLIQDDDDAERMLKNYSSLLDAIHMRQLIGVSLEDKNSSSGSSDLSDGRWRMTSSHGKSAQTWTNGEKIINCINVETVWCNSDAVIRMLDERLQDEFTRHIIHVVDGVETGKFVSQYVIQKLPLNADIP